MYILLIKKLLHYRTKHVACGSIEFKVKIADSFLKKMVGLMHVKEINADEGMLFVFGNEGRHGIWMHNMNFPIDIVWIGKDMRIVDIVKNAEPCNGVFGCKIYKPRNNDSFVLELKAGTAAKAGMKIGTRLKFYD